jgi:hypothetical protein
MRPPLRTPAILLGLALLAGCSTASPPDTAAPADPTTRAAAALRQSCGRTPLEDRMACYDRGLLSSLRESGVRSTMEMLDQLGTTDEVVQREGHMLAHSIGLAAYTTAEEVGSTFRQCTPSFQSGCYHGVIQAYFVDRASKEGESAVSEQSVNAVCADYRNDPSARWLLFQCVHGMGHGLTTLYGHDLPRALAACDLLESAWDREGCYGGAFMENVMQGTSPHHAIGRPGEEGAEATGHAAMDHAAMGHGGMDHAAMGHEGMEMGGMDHGAESSAFRPLDPADPTYPCSVVGERYRHSCWQMQTSAILYLKDQDLRATAAVCRSLEDAGLRSTCYQSLGRDIAPRAQLDPERAAELCYQVDEAYRPDCYTGFVKNVIDVTADASRGMEACRAAPDPEQKRACYIAVHQEAWALEDSTQVRQLCKEAEPLYRGVCWQVTRSR